MNENQTDRDEWLAAVEHNRKERIALLELASFMGWEVSPEAPHSKQPVVDLREVAANICRARAKQRESHNDR